MKKFFPDLNIDGIKIVHFTEMHLTERYVSWLNDPDVVMFSEQRHYYHSLQTCQDYFESIKKTDNLFLAIESISPKLGHVGNLGVMVDSRNRIADISIIIGEKNARGIGIASKAWKAVMRELLDNQGIRKVTAGTMAINDPMLRLIERSGMHIEAIKSRHFFWNGSEVDLIQAAVFN